VRVRAPLLLTIVALLAGASEASAATKVVNFDDQPVSTTIDTQYASSGVTFSTSGGALKPVVRDATGQAHSGTQVADFATCPTCVESYPTPTARGDLNITATSVSVYVGELSGGGRSTSLQLTAYDSANAVLAQSAVVTVTPGAGFATKLQVDSATPISYFVLYDTVGQTDSGLPVAMDDLTIVTPNAPQPPDFTLGSVPGVLDVLQGQSLGGPVSINRINGSTGDVTFSVSGLPTGMTGSFSPNPVTGTNTATTLTVTAAQGAAASTNYSTATITATPAASSGPTPRSATTLTRISENCSKTVRFDYVDLRSVGCLRKQGTSQYVALNTDVHINGLVLHPLDGDHVLTVDPVARTIKADLGATYSVAVLGSPDLPFYYGPIDWNFSTDSTPVPLDQAGAAKPKEVVGLNISGVQVLQGIPLTGVSAVFTQSGKAVVKPTLKLDFFPFNYIGAPTVSTSFITDNDHGASFNGLEIKLPEVDVLALTLKDIDLKYQDTGTWSGSANVVLDFANKLTVGAGFGLKQGHFDFLKGSVNGLNAAIGPAIFLQGLGFEVDTNPLTLKGQINLSAGPAIGGKAAITFNGGVTGVLADPWIVEVDGSAKVADRYELANAFLRYSSFGLFEFGAHVMWDLDPISVDGGVSGWVAGAHNWDIEGAVKGCVSVIIGDACADAKLLASDIGIAGCLEIFGEGVGAGAQWTNTFPFLTNFDAFTGCDLGPYRPTKPTARSAAAVQHLTVPGGLPVVAWSIDGTGGSPPDVTVAGPGNATVSVSQGAPFVRNSTFFAVESKNGRTYVLVNHPAAGDWTITANGAVPITRIRQAVGLPQPSVKAKVSGRARARVLHWTLRPLAGQVVRFAEIGKDVRRVITSTGRASGSVRFAPADGPAGRRTIEAIVQQGGQPRKTITVASYSAPGMLRPGKARALKLTRKGTTVTVRWRAQPGRFRNAVYLVLSDGRRLLRFVPANKHSVSFPGVAAALVVKATVTGLTSGNTKGPAASATLKPRKRKR
jgi:hypothetical protein